MRVTPFQLEASAKAPWTSTTVGFAAADAPAAMSRPAAQARAPRVVFIGVLLAGE